MKSARQADENSPVLIIGSHGRMGSMLLTKAQKAGIKAFGIDMPFDEQELERLCQGISMAILCVPVKHLSETIEKIRPFLPENTILTDITSVKEWPMCQMEKLWPGEVVGTHPLFGPTAEDEDLPVAVVRGEKTSRESLWEVEEFFKKLGCRVFECDAKTHDEAMARIQNMNFITNLAYFAALADKPDLLPFLTPSFNRRKNAAVKMLTDDAEMFAGLFDANQHSHEAVRQFRKMLNVAASGEIDLLLRKAQWWWQDDEKGDSRPKKD